MSEPIYQLRGLTVSAFAGGTQRGPSLQIEIGGQIEQLTFAETGPLYHALGDWLMRTFNGIISDE